MKFNPNLSFFPSTFALVGASQHKAQRCVGLETKFEVDNAVPCSMQRGGIQFMLEPSVHAKYPFMVLHSFPFLVVLVVIGHLDDIVHVRTQDVSSTAPYLESLLFLKHDPI